jgi:hypothetical protein
MLYLVEILLGLLLIFLLVGQPMRLHRFTQRTIGKVLFIAATIGAGLYSLQAGVLVALIYITLHKDFRLREAMAPMSDSNDEKSDPTHDFGLKHCKNGKVDTTTNPPNLTYPVGKCNPCETDCKYEISSGKEQITVDEALRPKESNALPVSK